MRARPTTSLVVLAALALSGLAGRAGAQVITEFRTPTSSSQPLEINPGPGGLWFAEPGAGRIASITVDGHVSEFKVTDAPHEIVAGPDGNLWFTSDSLLSRSTATGSITDFAVAIDDGYGSVEAGLAVGPYRLLWFAGSDAGQGFLFSSTVDGERKEYPIPGNSGEEAAIAWGPDGNLWLTEFGHYFDASLIRVTPSLVFTHFELPGRKGVGSIAAGPDGNMWFTETDSNRVGRITPSGQLAEFAVSGNPRGIIAGPDGNLWFAEYSGNKIGRITTHGEVTEFPIPTPNAFPWGICAGPDGNIWFTENGASQIGRLALSPPATEKTILTVPAVASIHGVNGTSFRSDLWLLNRSYSSAVTATLTYRCFGGGSCGGVERSVGLAARQSVLLEDVVGALLGAPGTAGALEIAFDSGSGPVTATSRVYTASPSGTLGTAVPALPAAAARLRSVFVGLAASGGALSKGFRSNAGAYNPNASPATVTFTLHGETGAVLGSTVRTLGPLEATQLYPNIFTLVGAGSVETRNAVLVVGSTTPVFSFVTVIDNQSGDSVFLASEPDDATNAVGADITGSWAGTFDPWDFIDCDGTIPGQASFQQNGEDVVGILNATGGCGFTSAAFQGKLQGDALVGAVTGDSFHYGAARVNGMLSGSNLEVTIEVACPGVLCIPGGAMHLHR
jgi:streptogramin lyase